jgi:paraquat-inducible protein B
MIKPRPVAVGAFLFAALALLVGGILFFTAGTLTAKHLRTVSFFPGTVAGLQVGSTVTFQGVPVGQVTSLGVRVTQDVRRPIIQVEMELVPSRVAVYGSPSLREDGDLVTTLVQRGLAAQLIKESFITGRLGVELAFRTGVQTSRVGGTDVPEVPTVPSDFAALARQLQAVDIAGAVESFQHTVASLDTLLNSPELRQTVREAPATLAQLRQTLATADREVAAFSRTGQGAVGDSAAALQKTLVSVQALVATLDRESTTTLTAMRGTLKRADGALDDSHQLLDPQGPMVSQLQQTVDDLATTAERLRNVAERVDRDPSVLVRGR